jgi:leucine-rich repeat protein SHOC2
VKLFITYLVIIVFTGTVLPVKAQDGIFKEEILYTDLKLALENPLKVKRLSLSGNKLTKFPKEILQFKNLVELDLSKNKLEKIPSEIGQLTRLEELNLAMNKLEELPVEVCDLKRLRKLDLRKNKVWKLPARLGDLKKLEYLNLNGNPLFRLPETIVQCTELRYLDLRNTDIGEGERESIRSMLPEVEIFFSNSFNCGPNN